MRLIRNKAITKNNIKAIIVGSISDQNLLEVLSFMLIFVEILLFFNQRSIKESFLGRIIISLGTFVIHLSSTVFQDRVAIALFQSINISLYSPELYFS